ncbi:MAG: hypothetical protein QOF14_3959 [Hyphomicrobiales bacterium]|jgi:hypothetical protein|nr:hypothetical protein [Hyphomicrobiales bacterium]
MSTEKVYEVTSVDLRISKSKPPVVQVKASGTVRTGGWKNGRLDVVVYVMPPTDGIQDLTFVADKPSGIVPEVITPIQSQELDLGKVPDWMRGVRVIAETNKVEEMF